MEINTNPVIFLDIDGVLNSVQYFETRKFLQSEEELNKEFDHEINDVNVREQIYLNDLNPKAVKLLNIIIRDVPDVEFVLSSTWRKSFMPDKMTEMMKKRGFKGTIKASTPVCNFNGSVRGNEIHLWLKNNRIPEFFNYVILDDDSDMLLHQKNNFLHIDGHAGLTPNHVYKISRFLNGQTNWL